MVTVVRWDSNSEMTSLMAPLGQECRRVRIGEKKHILARGNVWLHGESGVQCEAGCEVDHDSRQLRLMGEMAENRCLVSLSRVYVLSGFNFTLFSVIQLWMLE